MTFLKAFTGIFFFMSTIFTSFSVQAQQVMLSGRITDRQSDEPIPFVSIAFATTSSDSALPKALENMEKFGVPRKIVSFVIPTGYTFNLDGTTLYLSLASVFVAQAAGQRVVQRLSRCGFL